MLKPYHRRAESVNLMITEDQSEIDHMEENFPTIDSEPILFDFEDIKGNSSLSDKLNEQQIQELHDMLLKGDKTELKARFEALKIKYERINALNSNHLEELLKDKNVTEDKVEEERAKCGEYELRFLKIKETIFTETVLSDVEAISQTEFKTQIKLPKIELTKFDGDLKNWIRYWGQFTKIHNDHSLSDEDKFEYLRLSMEPGSSAQKLIEGFPPSKENYQKAIELLKSKYGKEEFLIEFYVRELLSLVLVKGKNILILQLYAKLETQLRALESLGITKE
ncbi:uncharacterized protein LOC118196830 [Stegodyphus dumicola]|uniref:uncharacterized protein LOC118196830 n=1 Tax=Stegodyphus dumicola TaxID=202533 RepID=UPI0015B10747|nr:uncharacterized protein LOC118196830 [Stegodyphus dumicola]